MTINHVAAPAAFVAVLARITTANWSGAVSKFKVFPSKQSLIAPPPAVCGRRSGVGGGEGDGDGGGRRRARGEDGEGGGERRRKG